MILHAANEMITELIVTTSTAKVDPEATALNVKWTYRQNVPTNGLIIPLSDTSEVVLFR